MAEYDAIVVGAGPAGSTAAKILAENDLRCILIEKEKLPRDKVCAGWLNRGVFEKFPYLKEASDRFISAAFYKLIFNSTDLQKRTQYEEEAELGYLVKRAVFDLFLAGIARDSGCELKDGCSLDSLSITDESVKAGLSDGSRISARVIIGADGVSSEVARIAGLNPGWASNKLILCLNKNIAVDEDRLDSFYGRRRPIHVSLGYSFISGYAWIFPKKDEIAVGIGGRASSTQGIGQTFERFVREAVQNKILPEGLDCAHPETALISAGAAVTLQKTGSGRVLLAGDAGGFASGSTAEGIFPAMQSAQLAAEIACEALKSDNFESTASTYNNAWRSELENYIKPPDASELILLPMIYSFKRIKDRVAGKFLYGKK